MLKKLIEYKIFELKYGNTKLLNVWKDKDVRLYLQFCFFLFVLHFSKLFPSMYNFLHNKSSFNIVYVYSGPHAKFFGGHHYLKGPLAFFLFNHYVCLPRKEFRVNEFWAKYLTSLLLLGSNKTLDDSKQEEILANYL